MKKNAAAFVQLRLRSEFSFKQAFGPIAQVVAAAKASGATAAALVDGGTWGHVRFAAACAKAEIQPIFGTEIVVPTEDGRRPVAWALAEDTKAFYRLSTAARAPEADVAALLAGAKGVVRFAGAALTDPALFDYIDINPASLLDQRRALALHKRTKKPLVVTGDNAYPLVDDRDAFAAMGGRERNTAQYILNEAELRAAFTCLDPAQFTKAMAAAVEIAERCATKLPEAPFIRVAGDFRGMVEAGRKSRLKRGHIPKWTKVYADRLTREIEIIESKGYQSYFLVVADLVGWAKKRMLVGPGRGSSAGSLLCYLTGITEVDPIVRNLLFERFLDLTRTDLPDIDIDFNDQKREEVFEYLAAKYGAQNVSRIGNINSFQARSVLAKVCKQFLIPDHERFNLVNVLLEYSSGDERYGKGIEDTLKNTDVGRQFTAKYPNSMVMTRLENHASHTGVHAAGVIVSMEAVSDYCTVVNGIAQIDKPDAVKLNLLKIDALGLRTLGVIEDAGVVTADELYNLSLDDPKVFGIFNAQKLSSVFQFEGSIQRQITNFVTVDKFETIDHITALARPGPLGSGAGVKYINCKSGKELPATVHPLILELLKDTFGVVLYQEQVMSIVRNIGNFSWEDATVIRKAMSGRKGEEFFNQKGVQFIKGAIENDLSEAAARSIWSEICTFGAWGMNKSHTCAYAVISYWCAWMKTYHPLEYAAACLRGAKDDDHRLSVLREITEEGTGYTPFDEKLSALDWQVVDGRLIGGFKNFKGVGDAKAAKLLEDRAAGKIDWKKLRAMPLKYQDLYPLQTKYASWYRDPESMGCEEGSTILTSDKFPSEGKVLYIGTVISKEPSDMNESVRIAKRGGKRLEGETRFIDFMCRDDMGQTIRCRVDRFNWENFGKPANDALEPGDEILMRGKRIEGFPMVNVFKIMCLNKPDLKWAVTPRRWHNN